MIARHFPLLALLVLAAYGCNSPQGPPMHEIAAEINATLAPVDDVIVAGDSLEVRILNFDSENVARPADYSQEFLVPVDGLIQVPGVGDIRAAGRSADQVAAEIRESWVPDFVPAVAVSFESQVGRSYHVLGAVRRPGEFTVEPDGRVTLVEAFARAGGVNYLDSYLGNVLIVRWDFERQRQVSWVVDARTEWWGEDSAILLQPNDVIFVPDTTVAKVNKWIDRYIVRMIPFPRFIVPAGV